MTRETFLRGALILAVGGLASRGLGAVYRFFLPWIMGPEAEYGIGLFNFAYPLYVFFLAVSSTGIPSAVAKLVAENLARRRPDRAQAVFRLSLLLMTLLGLALSGLLFWGAPYYARHVAREERAALSVIAVAPAVFFVSIMSAFRGYFQGHQYMKPTAVSQVVEQTVRIGTMLLLAWLLLPRGIEYSAAGATFGAVTGAVAGMLYLMFVYTRSGSLAARAPVPEAGRGGFSRRALLREIVTLAVPVSLIGVIQPIIGVLDSLIVPLRLHAAGFDGTEATSLYGILTGFAAPFMIAPTVFGFALASSLVPSVSEAVAVGDRASLRHKNNLGLRAILILLLPSAGGLLALAREIPATFFDSPETGAPLALLALGTVFLGMQQSSSSFLYGMGVVNAPVRSLVVGALVKFSVTWSLTAIPSMNINGAALGTTLGFLVAVSLNLRTLQRELDYRIPWWSLGGKTLQATVVMAVLARLTFLALRGVLGLKAATLAAVAAGGAAYVVILPLLGGVTARDLEIVPGLGPKLAGWLRRTGLLRG